MKKLNRRLIVVVFALFSLSLSCTSSKKLQQDDEFATDAVATDAPAETAKSSESSGDEFALDDTAAAAAPTAEGATPSPTENKDEFADFNDPSQTKPEVKDEFAEFDQAPAEANLEKELDNLKAETPAETIAETPPAIQPEKPVEPAPLVADVPPETPAPIVPEIPAPQPVAEIPPAPLVEPVPVEEPLARIQAVNYQSNLKGGTISIQADRPLQFTTRINSTTNQLVVEVQNSVIPARLKRSLNTKDMASSIGSVDIYQKPDSKIARFVVQMRAGAAEPLVQPEGTSLLIIGAANEPYLAQQKAEQSKQLQQSQVVQTPQSEGFTDLNSEGVMSSQSLEDFLIGNNKYYGKKISIETNNLEVKEALKFIAEESGANLLMDDGIEGKVSLKLRQVPWDQALILILKAKKLGYVRQGNVLRIATLAELQKEETEAYKLLENRRSNEPLIVKRFFISYANLKDLETKIKDFIATTAAVNNATPIGATTIGTAAAAPGTPGAAAAPTTAAGATAGAASAAATAPVPPTVQRGRVLSDERTGTLIVTDTPDNIAKIEKLIAALDTQPKQIVVESKIISATENFTRSLGIVWGSNGSTSSANNLKLGINNLPQKPILDSTFTWGNLDIVGDLTARIALGEMQEKVRVLSTQRTTVISGQIAKIEAKSKINIPIQTTVATSATPVTTSGFTTVEYGLTGDITPQASNENTISAAINLVQIKLDEPSTGNTTTEAIGGKVVARNGQTVVVQANFSSTDSKSETGVPGLKDVPVLGILFRGKTDALRKAETMLFATLNILEPVNGGGLKKASVDPKSELEIK